MHLEPFFSSKFYFQKIAKNFQKIIYFSPCRWFFRFRLVSKPNSFKRNANAQFSRLCRFDISISTFKDLAPLKNDASFSEELSQCFVSFRGSREVPAKGPKAKVDGWVGSVLGMVTTR